MITKYIHIKTFVGFLFLLLATAACSNEEETVVMPSSNESMKLQVTIVDNAVTRTDGDDTLNENLFVTLDYYFFANKEEVESNTLLLHKSETGLNPEDENNISNHTYQDKFSDKELEAVFGADAATGTERYVYVVANLDATTRKAISDDITLYELKHKYFQTEGISDNKAQPSFVMYGGDNVTLTITTEGSKTTKSVAGQVKVTRNAAKVVVTITKLEKKVTVEGANGDKQYWVPQYNNIYVMFYNGVNKSNIHSQINPGYHYVPADHGNDCYFSLNTTDTWRGLTIHDENDNYKNITHQYPFYTYLSNWDAKTGGNPDYSSYMILVVPWKQVDASGNPVENAYNGSTNFVPTYYQIETTPVDEHAYYENTFYQVLIKVGVLGSFELPEPVKVEAKYMVVDWGTKEVPATLREGNYLIMEKNYVEINNEKKGFDPYITSHPITTTITKVEYMDYSSVTIYKYSIEKGSFKNGNYTYGYKITRLNTADNNTTIYYASRNGDNTVYDSRNRQVTNTPNFKAIFDGFESSYDNSNVILTHDIPDDMYVPYDVTVQVEHQSGYPSVTPETVVFTQYPPIYITGEKSNGYAWVNNWDNTNRDGGARRCWDDRGEGTNTGNNRRLGNLANLRGSLDNTTGGTSQNPQNPNNYIISISSFSDDTYVIGDPRSSTVNNLNNLAGLTQYRPTRTTGTENMIAPEILVASAYGVVNSNYYFNKETAEKRCASYQENGYPAGRWRVPTAAEIKFIMSLHAQGYIPPLFNLGQNDGQGYWCANGKISGDANAMPYLSNNTQNTAVRCVYDIWYWGEEHSQYATTFHYGDND